MLVEAPQIAAPNGHAVAIEEFENLNRDLAPVVDAVAKLGRGEFTALDFRREVDHHIDHFADRAAQKEMIVRDLVDPADAPGEFQQPPHLRLGYIQNAGDVARPRWTK